MKKNIFAALVALTLMFGFAGSAFATGGALSSFSAQYPGTSYSCSLCHTSAPNLNPYGAELALPVTATQLTAIENNDADNDGATNIDEINSGTMPGDKTSTPPAPAPAPDPSPAPAPAPVSQLTIMSPNGAEVLASGDTVAITYDAPAEAVSFKVRYSLNGGETWSTADGIQGAGIFDWNVPTPVANKTRVLLKVVGFDSANTKVGADRCDGAFIIEVASITAPIASEEVPAGGVYNVTWLTNGTSAPVDSVKVFYTFGNSGVWKRAAGTVIDPLGSFDWNVPSPADAKNAKLKVVMKDASGKTVGKAISNTFTVR